MWCKRFEKRCASPWVYVTIGNWSKRTLNTAIMAKSLLPSADQVAAYHCVLMDSGVVLCQKSEQSEFGYTSWILKMRIQTTGFKIDDWTDPRWQSPAGVIHLTEHFTWGALSKSCVYTVWLCRGNIKHFLIFECIFLTLVWIKCKLAEVALVR